MLTHQKLLYCSFEANIHRNMSMIFLRVWVFGFEMIFLVKYPAQLTASLFQRCLEILSEVNAITLLLLVLTLKSRSKLLRGSLLRLF
jgi:hypothetical protein